MTKKRKIAIGLVSVLVLALLGGGWAVSEAYERSPFKRGPAFFLDRMDERAEELNLSPSQKERFEALKSEIKGSMVEGREEGRNFFKSLKTEVGKEDPDINAVSALVKAQMTRIHDRVGQGIDRFAEFYAVLDDKQKEKVLAKFRAHMDRPRHRGGPGHWGPKDKKD